MELQVMAEEETPEAQDVEAAAESQEVEQTDRRCQQRTKIEIKRTIFATIEQEAIEETGCHLHLLDISEGGMRVNIDQDLDPEARVGLKFDLSSLGSMLKGNFDSVCRVVWTKPTPGGTVTGLQFKELKQDSDNGLKHLLDFWSQKSSLDLTRLWKPINSKLRVSEDQPWSRTLFVQALSLRGFQFRSSDQFEQDQILQSRLLLNDGPLVTPVAVRWCTQTSGQSFDTGCQFEDLSAEDKASIRLHLKRTGNATFRK